MFIGPRSRDSKLQQYCLVYNKGSFTLQELTLATIVFEPFREVQKANDELLEAPEQSTW